MTSETDEEDELGLSAFGPEILYIEQTGNKTPTFFQFELQKLINKEKSTIRAFRKSSDKNDNLQETNKLKHGKKFNFGKSLKNSNL
ncbi:hypothetical protein BLOT_009802 [Blomia tropicalis]|nr:hypothetical protein BLOT_009802 [Blomia tropicalis]